ncbi:alpha/beta fold hydrolase [Corallococcus praedator]|uniref:Alpha/beta fold hydrolase n=1 Tax=Corallococcus praedator TaxID=2316724 RepID=A0ABX9QAR8_9BACT|nr:MULTISPECIES: alpha/beta fold hydrolase [Corallococcus]RKH03306.1 alpha/beta fold hydrolase [Corallococcus sp. CA047B]RKH35137.1 alpha/beta fold hydrolase [Corallococcus sp. CA031C]RKH93460.1 alpha/beta fold hydrolase [Corallococcus praedator]
MLTVAVDGIPLHYRDVGQGLPVLLLHAFPLDGSAFERQVAALSGRYRFLVPDLRGFGQTPLGEGPMEMRRLAQDGLALLDALNIDAAVVGGVSMGGYAAMALLREDAGRVRGLVLVDTQCTADDDAGREKREATAQQALTQGASSVIQGLVPKLVHAGADSPVGREVTAMGRAASPQALAAAQRGMAQRPDSKDILARFAGPTLVVVGEHDTITPLAKAKQMVDLVQGARLEVITDAAHLPNQEQPEAFNAVLDAFLASLS